MGQPFGRSAGGAAPTASARAPEGRTSQAIVISAQDNNGGQET